MKYLSVILLFGMLFSSITFAAEGVVDAGGFMDYSNVKISGAAAKDIFDAMKSVELMNHRIDHIFKSKKQGKNITCEMSVDSVVSYNCIFSVDQNGEVSRDLLK